MKAEKETFQFCRARFVVVIVHRARHNPDQSANCFEFHPNKASNSSMAPSGWFHAILHQLYRLHFGGKRSIKKCQFGQLCLFLPFCRKAFSFETFFALFLLPLNHWAHYHKSRMTWFSIPFEWNRMFVSRFSGFWILSKKLSLLFCQKVTWFISLFWLAKQVNERDFLMLWANLRPLAKRFWLAESQLRPRN